MPNTLANLRVAQHPTTFALRKSVVSSPLVPSPLAGWFTGGSIYDVSHADVCPAKAVTFETWRAARGARPDGDWKVVEVRISNGAVVA